MTVETVLAWFDRHPDITGFQAAIVDHNGELRGKRLPLDQLSKVLSGGLRMPFSACNVDIWGQDIADSPWVFETGDGDGKCEWTGREPALITWNHENTALIPLQMVHEDNRPFYGDPRQLLSRIVQRFHDRGWYPVVATELEFYLTKRDAFPLTPPHSPVTGAALQAESVYSLTELDHFDAFLTEVYAACQAQGVPADSAIVESGAGQFEINLLHSDDPLKAADDALLFKRLVKRIAQAHGMVATFMAKPYAERSGSGMHVHASLQDAHGQNLFDDGTDQGSALLGQAIAGILATLNDSALMLAPHRNSWRRLAPGSHAPTRICWGYENRTAAVRVPAGTAAARRLEHRVAGADANPWLVLSAVLSGMWYGLQSQLDLPPPLTGNAYESEHPALVNDWTTAIQRFAGDNTLTTVLPADFIQMYSACKRQEYQVFEANVSAFEFDTYLETV